MVVGLIGFLLKEKKLKESFLFIGIGVWVFLFIMIFDYVFPIYEAIVINNNNKNISFLKHKIFVPLGSKKKFKNKEIKRLNILTTINLMKFSVIVKRTNDEKFTDFIYWNEKDDRKDKCDFLRLYLWEKVINSY